MVAYSSRVEDDLVFRALADATRRALLDSLFEHNGQTLSQLCARFSRDSMSRQAISKHLALLEAANLIATRRQGRDKLHYLNPIPIHEIADRWIAKYQRLNLAALHELKERLEGANDSLERS
jgi:DNA-binding transcriptional ArsR family regulator